ncbi:MAG: GNAT family N-acetyltransferase [Alphaproteobacteria bacterium]
MPISLRTERLLLRDWRDDDRAAFAAMSADPAVMRWLPPPAPDAIARMRAHWKEHGFGRFAVELPGKAAFIGVVGLSHVPPELPFAPAVEIAWRLLPAYWGQGYATEAAQAAIEDGFGRLGLAEIVAFTVPANTASRRVMARLGMTRDPFEDFDNPRLPPGHELRGHILCRLKRPPA